MNLILWIYLTAFLVFPIASQTLDQLKTLRKHLFLTNGYDKFSRPSKNQSVSTNISVDYFLAGLNGLDLVSQKFSTTGFLYVTWVDEALTWTPASHGDIQSLFIPQGDIWKPDLTLKNGFTKLSELGSKFLHVKIDYQGNVVWKPYEVFESKCSVDIKYYPFDTQTCAMEFVSWSTDMRDVHVIKGSQGVVLLEFGSSSEWDITSLSSVYENEGFDITLIFNITIKRKPMFFILNMVFPVILLGLLDVFTFVLPDDCGEKISYSITVFLANAVFLSIVSASLPANSQTVSLISVYLIAQLVQGTLVIMFTSIQLRMIKWDNSKRIPHFLRQLTIFTRRMRCQTRVSVMGESTIHCNDEQKFPEDNVIDKEEDDNDVEEVILWSEVSAALDIHFFILFLAILLIFTITIFIVGLSA